MDVQTSREKSGRLQSLDAFRGLDMWFITGGAFFLRQLSELITGEKGSWLSVQMTHLKWEGLHVYDFVFPLFLFIAGVSWPFSLAKRRANGATNGQLALHVLKRVVTLVVIGLVCRKIQFCQWDDFIFWSVLGRIGLAWGLAAMLFALFRPKTCRWILLGWFVAWGLILAFVPNPNHADEMVAAGLGPMSAWRYSVFGWIWPYTSFSRNDGSGLDVLGMVPLVMAGVFAGGWLRRTDASGDRKAALMSLVGVGLVAFGVLVAFGLGPLSMPIVKKAFSPSYSLITGGTGIALLAAFYWIIDVKGWVGWSLYFRVIGANAIAIYAAGYFVPFQDIARFFLGTLPKLCARPGFELTVVALGALAVRWVILYFLYKRKIFIKV